MTTTYKILYWQEVPSQIKAEDERDDDLAQWQWSDEQQRPGSAEDVAAAVVAELEAEANW